MRWHYRGSSFAILDTGLAAMSKGDLQMLRLVLASLFLVFGPAAALAQKRVALVIGNSAYQHTPALTNPVNDARDMAAALKRRGFEIIEGFDLDKTAFDRKTRDFATALTSASAGLLFYAGHGLQVAGVNYLVPIDAQLTAPAALDFEMVRMDVLQRAMEQQTTTNVLFLDACRDNPLARNLARSMGTRSAEIGHGLAPVESGVGTLISFSTQPGNVALDGAGRNSPFAGALVKHISISSDDLSAILITVRNDVRKATKNKQVPWEHSALTGRFYFNAGKRPSTASWGVTAKGLFTAEDAKRLRALADENKVPLPDFQIDVPAADVPANLRRFIGVWVNEPSKGGQGRANILVCTRVFKDGRLDGFYAFGPPVAASQLRYPAALYGVAGRVSDRTLLFESPSGLSKYRLTLNDGGKIDFVFSSTNGEAGNKTLLPFWTLVEAESRKSKAAGPTAVQKK